MKGTFRCLLIAWSALFAIAATGSLPAAECQSCRVSLDIPPNELWQGVRKGDLTIFAMKRGDELFATIEVLKVYNEGRYSLDRIAGHYSEFCNADIVIDGRFAKRTINGIPVRWGRGHGRAEDGSEFLVHLVFFIVDESNACMLTAVVRRQSRSLYEYLLPEIIGSLGRLPDAPSATAAR
jgi:hypothetical protein